jgi:hypothetical protein
MGSLKATSGAVRMPGILFREPEYGDKPQSKRVEMIRPALLACLTVYNFAGTRGSVVTREPREHGGEWWKGYGVFCNRAKSVSLSWLSLVQLAHSLLRSLYPGLSVRVPQIVPLAQLASVCDVCCETHAIEHSSIRT